MKRLTANPSLDKEAKPTKAQRKQLPKGKSSPKPDPAGPPKKSNKYY